MRLMQRIRDSIKNDTFPDFVKKFVRNYYSHEKNHEVKKTGEQVNIPEWVINSLNAVNIYVLD